MNDSMVYHQVNQLHDFLKMNGSLYRIIKQMEGFGLEDYYVGGGSIAQSVWNVLLGNPLEYGISDIDIVYFDVNLSHLAEEQVTASIQGYLNDTAYCIDVANEARVHLWYEEAFDKKIKPYRSVEHAISTWPTSATSIGVRLMNNELIVFAPYGLSDLFNLTIRPNKKMIDKEIYDNKVTKWKKKWPELKIVGW